ncbi:MAG: hypothetical protein Q7U02_06810, partial [Desulfosalsimonadaceae bacterium]|nr:hypothetical protein [Desulfosalsimonadaceae bacterium]
ANSKAHRPGCGVAESRLDESVCSTFLHDLFRMSFEPVAICFFRKSSKIACTSKLKRAESSLRISLTS